MRAGKLNKRITIQAVTESQDATGEIVTTWANFAIVWASVVDISGREFIAAGANQNEVQTRIIIRKLSGVVPSMRVVHGSVTYSIDAVLVHDNVSLMLMCSRLE
jgi:SPP1 family predicted phage head-tail adaptor